MSLFPDNVSTVYDLWLLGDNFLQDIFGSFEALRYYSQKNNEEIPPYIQQYFNVKECYHASLTSGVKFTMVWMINTLIEVITDRKRIPKYLLVIPDKDILYDFDTISPNAQAVLHDLTCWFVHQIHLIIRRKKIDFLNRKPGATAMITLTTMETFL